MMPKGRTGGDRKRRSLGRYDIRGDEYRLAQVGEPASRNVQTTVVAVDDPGNPKDRVFVAAHRRVDVLELERSRGLISEAAYRAGRSAQRVFELARGPGGSNWIGGDRIDGATQSEIGALCGLEIARKVKAYMSWLLRGDVLGFMDAMLLRGILGDRLSYGECATRMQVRSTRGVHYVAQRFRHALERLAECSAATGKQCRPQH